MFAARFVLSSLRSVSVLLSVTLMPSLFNEATVSSAMSTTQIGASSRFCNGSVASKESNSSIAVLSFSSVDKHDSASAT